jgi:hypothetical protein
MILHLRLNQIALARSVGLEYLQLSGLTPLDFHILAEVGARANGER